MQIWKLKLRVGTRRALATIASAPMMAALALASIAITVVVALGTVSEGRLPANGSIGLVCGLVLAAVAAAEASRPARRDRSRQRTRHLPPAGTGVSSGREER